MSDDLPFEPPVITDEDVRWASRLLFSRDDAFHGETGTDPRQEVLKSMGRIDVAACPGSGKTTLLVAKLGILAEKWQHRTRGICVLSHTNAARHEIESRLGNTAAGQRLLAYPHFIGTIHEFVDKFLTLPLLRSLGYKSTQFSTEIAGQRLWALSGYGAQLPAYLYRKISDADRRKAAFCHAQYVGENCDLRLEAGNQRLNLCRKKDSVTFRVIDEWKASVLDNGYAAYEDTFAYGYRAMKENRYLVSTLRGRFPLLFIDEAQDNSEEQSVILHDVFIAGDDPVIRQRFGDPNQAIFNFVGAKGATKHTFPGDTIKKDLPNSHRFGEKIARLASPLGVTQYDGGLIGQGPSMQRLSRSGEGRHTILFFGDDSAGKVLDAYGDLLLDTFFEQELRQGTFVAVGQVHKPKGDDQKPRHVGHYWPDYDPELSKAEPKPQTFVQYVSAGQGKADEGGEAYPAVEKIAAGILRLAAMAGGGMTFRSQRHNHRQVMSYLEESAGAREGYLDFVADFALTGNALSKEAWGKRWRETVRSVGEAVSGATLSGPDVEDFLQWKGSVGSPLSPADAPRSSANIYRYSKDGRQVAVRVGSIHSVKGETHTATLVLETFWYDHNLKELLPWLEGSESGAKPAKNHQTDRLKLHYVAMTRPTHLLCLAMKRRTLEDGEGKPDQNLIGKLERHGWRVKVI